MADEEVEGLVVVGGVGEVVRLDVRPVGPDGGMVVVVVWEGCGEVCDGGVLGLAGPEAVDEGAAGADCCCCCCCWLGWGPG